MGHSDSRWGIWVLAVVLLVLNSVVFAHFRVHGEQFVPLESTKVAGGSLVSAVHQRRVDERIQVIGDETLEQLIDNLDDTFSYFMSGTSVKRDNVDGAQLDFPETLAHRRVLRIIEILEELPNEEARRKCRWIFDRKFAEQNETIDRIFTSYEKPRSRRSQLSFGAHDPLPAATTLGGLNLLQGLYFT